MLQDSSFRRMRRLSVVPRWTVVPTIQRQNVAEHSFHVCTLALWLAGMHERSRLGTMDLGALMIECLRHDESEAVTGDIAAPAKSFLSAAIKGFEAKNGMYPTADADYGVIIKCADLLEALLFLKEDQAMGNRRVDSVVADIAVKLSNVWMNFTYRSDCEKHNTSAALIAEAVSSFLGDLHRHPGLEIK